MGNIIKITKPYIIEGIKISQGCKIIINEKNNEFGLEDEIINKEFFNGKEADEIGDDLNMDLF